MPDGVEGQFTVGRAVDANGDIHIEGRGVVPNLLIPITEATLFGGGDPILDAAIAYLDELLFR